MSKTRYNFLLRNHLFGSVDLFLWHGGHCIGFVKGELRVDSNGLFWVYAPNNVSIDIDVKNISRIKPSDDLLEITIILDGGNDE
jgi:hypothetical protein